MARPLIHLRPVNGLGNRMRALAAGRALALATGARLKVLWEVVPDLAIRYEALFVPTGEFEVRNVEPGRSLADTAYYLAYSETKSVRGVPTGWISQALFPGKRLRNLRPEHYAPEALEQLVASSERLFIESWWAFYGGEALDFSFFRLQPPLEAAVEAVTRRFGPNTIGVHIRRADNVNAIRNSPTWAFIAAMRQLAHDDPTVSFFLTTDSAETESEVVAALGDRVVTRPRQTVRDSREGMLDAVVDLFVLSRTRRILGSYYSTFSETASSLGRIGWVTVTHDPELVCNSAALLVTPEPVSAGSDAA